MQRPFTFTFLMLNNFDSREGGTDSSDLEYEPVLGPSEHGNQPSGNFQPRFADWICQPHHTVIQPQQCIQLQFSFISVWVNHYCNLPTDFVPLTLLLKCHTLRFFQRQILPRFVLPSTSVLSPGQTLTIYVQIHLQSFLGLHGYKQTKPFKQLTNW
jgi:hypothetical protein